MAFEKTFSFPNGITGNYVSIHGYRWDRWSREASFIFDLYVSHEASQAAPGDAVRPVFAKLRLTGDKFDEWVGNAVLDSTGKTLIRRAYEAARVEPVICDIQPAAGQATVFSDAVDV